MKIKNSVQNWLFKNKRDDLELKEIREVRRSTRIFFNSLYSLYSVIENKLELIKKPGIANPKKIKQLNDRLNKAFRSIDKCVDFEENFLKHTLLEISQEVYQISDKLNIKPITDNHKINNIEELKRKAKHVLMENKEFQNLLTITKNQIQEFKEKIKEYKSFIDEENALIKNRNDLSAILKREIIIIENDNDSSLKDLIKNIIKEMTATINLEAVEEKDHIYINSLLSKGSDEQPELLIFHGMANSPEENRDISAYFANLGFSVYAPRLPGCGNDDNELYDTSINEVRHFAQNALDYYTNKLRKPVFIVGLSLGAMLALELASRKENNNKILGIISINALMVPYDKGAQMLSKIPFGERILNYLIKRRKKYFLPRKSINFNNRVKELAKLYNKSKNKSGIENEIIIEFEKLIGISYKDVIEEQIKERPNDRNQIISDVEKTKRDAIEKFRYKIMNRNKDGEHNISYFDIMDLTKMVDYRFHRSLTWKGMMEITKYANYLKSKIPHISVPTYIIQSELDKTVDPRSAEIIFDLIKSKIKDKWTVKNVGHVVLIERNNEKVFEKILGFINDINNTK